MPRILIVTGEASGELHGANLARALHALRPDVELLGVGSAKLQAAGVALVQGNERLDGIGMVGVAHLRAGLRTYRTLARFFQRTPLDAAVFIDAPGLNLRLARAAKRAGHRVIYYVAPQVWAWHPGRVRLIARVVDRLLVILPFEEALFREAGIRCDFVGHPLLDVVAPSYDRAELRKRFGVETGGPVIGVLPGSREREVQALFPEMLAAATALSSDHPGLQVLVAQAPSIPTSLVEVLCRGHRVPVRIVPDLASEVMAASDVLLVASGTATLQAAIVGTPMVLAYRVSPLTYWLARWLIRANRTGLVARLGCIGLVNIVAGRRIVPELLQGAASGARLREEAARLLDDGAEAEAMRAALRRVRAALGEPGASRRAAALVLEECGA
ncbi:lipid-A-disaccharide synthase [Nitrospira sp. Kam-Ns4a]